MYCKNTSVLLSRSRSAKKDYFPTRHMNAFLISLATPLANAITSKPLVKFIEKR